MNRRNGPRSVVGSEPQTWTLTIVVVLAFIAFLLAWEYAARSISGFAADYSAPSQIGFYLNEYAYVNLHRAMLTAGRAAIGISIAFFVAYPLGVLLPCIGPIRRYMGVLIALLILLPKLMITLLIEDVVGYNETSLFLIGLWTGCGVMVRLGYGHAYTYLTEAGLIGEIIDTAELDGVNRRQLWWHILLPLLRSNHITSLYSLTGAIWTSLTFAEALILTHIQGLGERMYLKSYFASAAGHFFAASFLLFLLELGSWGIIYLISQRTYPARNALIRWFRAPPD